MRRTLYWKRLLIVVAATVLLSGTVFAVHYFQVQSQSSIYLLRAQQIEAEAEKDPSQRGEAIAFYREYLRFNPRDEAAFLKYAQLYFVYAKEDRSPGNLDRAAAGVEEFLRAFPNHPEERQKLVDLYLSTGQYGKLPLAKQHLGMLFSSPTGDFRNNIEVREMAAACEYGLDPDNIEGALAHLQAAIDTGKAPVRVYVRAMQLHHANKKDRERKNKIDALLSALRSGRFERNLEARVAAARFEMALGNLNPARNDLAFARDRLGGGDDPDALLAMAELELAGIRSADEIPVQNAKAEAHLSRAFARDPKNVPVGMMLAEVLARLGKREDGVKVLKRTAEALGTVNDQYLQLVDRLIDLGEQESSAALVEARLAPDASMSTIVLYYRGRLAVLKQEWPAALKTLDQVAPNLTRVPMYHKKVMLGLAACYAAMQNPDKQLEYCRLALRDDAGYAHAVVGEAEALAKMGKHEEALHRYRAIVYVNQITAYRPELVRLELLVVSAQPPETRDWRRFDESLGPVAQRTADIHISHAESLVARGAPAEAVKSLRGWLADPKNLKDPKAPAVWVALARVAEGAGEPPAAVLDEAQKRVGNTADIRLARAALLVTRPKPAAPADFDALAVGAEGLPKAEQSRLYFGLGQAAARVADRGPDGPAARAVRAAAIRYLRAAADRAPKDLACRAMLIDQATAAGLPDVVNRTIKEMAEIEGENGPVGALARFALRFPEVKATADRETRAAGLKELRALAERVRDLRPGWSRVYVALAQLDELEGLNNAALVNYKAAIDRGERQETVIRRAVELYRARQQDLEAVALLDRLSTDVRLPDDLERFRAIHRMLATELPKDARQTIDRIAPFEGHRDYRLMMLRGALLAAVRDDENALKAFERAVEWQDKLPETWASLVAELMKQGMVARAKEAVTNEAEKKLALPPTASAEERAERRLAVGGLYEMVGDLKGALAHYTAARDTAPLELNPTRQLVLFFQRTGEPAKADALLAAAKDSSASGIARWARRHLAITLMSRPDAYARRAEALALVESNLAAAPDDAEDLKARAVVWTVDPATREEGVRVLRKFGDANDLTPDEFFLLGQLAFDQGKYTEAAQQYARAARIRPGVTPRHLTGVVRAYLAMSQQEPVGSDRGAELLKLAEEAVGRLKTYFPKSWEAAREEARLLYRKSRERAALAEPDVAAKLLDEAKAVIKRFPGWDAGANLAARSGPLFEELGMTTEAGEAYTKFKESGRPGAPVPLAVFYIRQKRPEAAIRLAPEYEKKAAPLLTARLLTGAARAGRLDAATVADIDRWLDEALKNAAGQSELEAALIGSRAELLDAQKKYPEAIAEYRRSLAKGKSDLVVNNMCMLLALHAPDKAEEAVRMMTELIAIRGPAPSYLDTRAVAYLVSSRPAEAVKDLQLALAQAERPVYRFHLGWALDLDPAKDRRIFARDELERAKQLGLTGADLHPIEHPRYLELMAKYRLSVDEK
ncbi:MAG: hypothetical protein J0I06_01780 [Planctomycetes bacterium]|nr:hypothetical protein [Planctomycetota bacterium]